ncbi:MAG: hypothetical protein KAU58_01880 [Candidatus Omnitrophica bacterium]|nr:hypothetical protein [Candidatus Omnitrophota bacterium]
MGIFEINPKLADIKAKIEKVNIGLNKEEKKILIDHIDQSTQIHYHNEIGLSNETTLKLSNEDVGKLVRHRAWLNIKAALTEKPDEIKKLMAMFDSSAFTTGASLVSGSHLISSKDISPMPPGDFIKQIPGAIEASSPHDFMSVDEHVNLELDKNNDDTKKK